MNIFLDDIRIPSDAFFYTKDTQYLKLEWTIVRNYDEFVSAIIDHFNETGKIPELISYDHDLADDHYNEYNQAGKLNYDSYKELTGYHCADWLVHFCMDNNLKMTRYKVHSMNPVGGDNIMGLLDNFSTFQSRQ